MKRIGLAIVGLLAAGCAALNGSSSPAVASPVEKTSPSSAAATGEEATATATATAAAEAAEPEPIPTSCGGEQPINDVKACLVPEDFVKKLCTGSYPDVTLWLFAKGTPWTRVWLSGDVEAWSASGGFTSRTKLAFDEEVLVLTRHAAPSGANGIVVTSAGASFDVLRWDGTCVSVQEGEVTAKRPPAPKQALMRWAKLEEATRRTLLASAAVKTSQGALEKACSGDKTSCERAEKDLSLAIANAVRAGGTELPAPTRRP